MTVKQEIENLRKQHSLVLMNKDDMLTAIEFVGGLMEIAFEKVEREEPHATRTINEMKKAFEHIRDLDELIEEEFK